MVTVVWSVSRQLEGSQLRQRIPDVDMVNPAPSCVSGPSHKLLEAKVIESSSKETVGMLVQADIHVPRNSSQPLHVDKLFQIVHQIFLASIG